MIHWLIGERIELHHFRGRSGRRGSAAPTTALALALWLVTIVGCFFLVSPAPEAQAQEAAGGKVLAWGLDNYGQTAVPQGAQSGIKAVAGGVYHSLALKEDGSVIAWGSNQFGQTNVPQDAQSDVKAIAAGYDHNLALKNDGSIVAWGSNQFRQTNVPLEARSGVKAIAGGGRHSLALKEDGSVVSWGLGQPELFVPEGARSDVVAIAAGIYNSLALKNDGSVVDWGDNGLDQTNVPQDAQSDVKAIAAGGRHRLALKEDGTVVAWGDNYGGQSTVPENLSGVKAIAAGGNHSLALKEDGSVVGWGSNFSGETTFPGGARSGIEAIGAGQAHSLAVKADTAPPAAVGSFSATVDPVGETINLSWTNPPDADFDAVRILRSSNGFYAANPEPSADQTLVYEGPAESFTDTGLTNGTEYKYTAYAHDGKNFSEWATTLATPYDTGPPDTVLDDGGPTGVVAAASAAFGFSSTEEGSTFECSLDSASFAECESGKAYENLDDGPHAFEVRATDALRNTDLTPARRQWTVDTGPPDTAITSGPSGTTKSATAGFELSSTERDSTFECRLDDEDFAACEPGKTYENLSDGYHVFEVRAVDAAGTTDLSPVRRTWSVDTAAPNTGITNGPSGAANSATAAFEFLATESSATFECSLDGADFAACDSPEELSGLSDGPHTFRVRATDAAGNVDSTPASRTWSVDATTQDAPVITAPADGSYHANGSFVVRGTAEKGATVELFEGTASQGTANADADGSWSMALSEVADGAHEYTAKATDAAGNASLASASVTITVDTLKPSVTPVKPARGAARAAASSSVTATFSEAMDPETITTKTVRLVKVGTRRAVPAKVSYNPATDTVTLKPSSRLEAGAKYTATITTGAKDLAGNPLSAAKTWRFTVKR